MKTRIAMLVACIPVMIVSCVTGNLMATILSALLPTAVAIWAEVDGYKAGKRLETDVNETAYRVDSYDEAFETERDTEGKIKNIGMDCGTY